MDSTFQEFRTSNCLQCNAPLQKNFCEQFHNSQGERSLAQTYIRAWNFFCGILFSSSTLISENFWNQNPLCHKTYPFLSSLTTVLPNPVSGSLSPWLPNPVKREDRLQSSCLNLEKNQLHLRLKRTTTPQRNLPSKHLGTRKPNSTHKLRTSNCVSEWVGGRSRTTLVPECFFLILVKCRIFH